MPSTPPWPFRRVCVFCGSSAGARPSYRAAAVATGRLLAEHGVGIVYGGGSAGLMGALADAALDAGGEVIGVLPVGLFPDGVTASPLRDHHAGTLVIEHVADMHTRKARFHALADAFVVLPGGIGTLEEAAEAATWAQIGIHDRPIGFLDVDGYYDDLFAWFDRSVTDGFLRPANRASFHVDPDPAALLDRMADQIAASLERESKWIDP